MINVSANRPQNLPETPQLPLPSPDVGTVPLVQLENGAVRFAGTRVSLESIIFLHKQGQTPQQINDAFDLISTHDIEKAIEYYEAEKECVDRYLAVSQKISAAWREFDDARTQSGERTPLPS